MPFHSKISARLLLTTATVGLLVAGVVGVAGSPALAGVSAGQAGPNGSSTASLSAAVTTSDWTTFDHDSLRSGVDPSGNSFSPATPAWTSPTFDGQLYGQPLVATGRVFVATENDTVYALAANTGAVLWSNHLGTPLNPSTVPGLCGDIHPTVGITGTPVIDAARSEIFVVATVSCWQQCRPPAHRTGHLHRNGAVEREHRPTRRQPGLPAATSLPGPHRRPGDRRLRWQFGRLRPLPRVGGVGSRGRLGPIHLHGGQPAGRQPGRGVDGWRGSLHRCPGQRLGGHREQRVPQCIGHL